MGPSSHVFLSNRAAALLSLKRYHAAATDARRAVALAPTFGKAHARLGQALYFLKDYPGAVAAYEDAIQLEPDNQVTKTYLEKAKAKLRRMEENSSTVSSVMHEAPSIATDPNHVGLVGPGYNRNATALHNATKTVSPRTAEEAAKAAEASAAAAKLAAAASPNSSNNSSSMIYASTTPLSNDDPDFEEALRIQQRANHYLANKDYKAAIEEYTAALFLVPNDALLSADLHLGRAHALNGSRRHERAKNDAVLAIKLQPSPAAYSTLAKSLFYMKDYRASIEAFDECIKLLPPGETLGMFDKAYMQKAEAALAEEDASLRINDNRSTATVPKLPPPRFVPREEAIQSTPNLPPMPRQWPQQSPRATDLKCGPERVVLCLSEGLGIKLNRGSDGIVRIIWVSPDEPGSPVARQGTIEVGDVIREAAGVDIRRPITNIMWGDTVALIKMAPRPIKLIVAKELSPVPPAVLDEMRRSEEESVMPPSSSSGDGPVPRNDGVSTADVVTLQHQQEEVSPDVSPGVPTEGETPIPAPDLVHSHGNIADTALVDPALSSSTAAPHREDGEEGEDETKVKQSSVEVEFGDRLDADVVRVEEMAAKEDSVGEKVDASPVPEEGVGVDDQEGQEEVTKISDAVDDASAFPSLRDEEEQMIGGEVLFERTAPAAYCGWDNLRWLSYSGERKVKFGQACFRLFENERKQLFFTKSEMTWVPRFLAVYDEPRIIVVLRQPRSSEEVRSLLGLPDIAELEESETSVENYWIVESVADPEFCKLRLSSLTSPVSSAAMQEGERRKSCFELITPTESILLSVVRVRSANAGESSFADSGAFLETTATETALVKAIGAAHDNAHDIGVVGADISWKHQTILGTLHSIVVSGDTQALEEAIQYAKSRVTEADNDKLPSRVVDVVDDNGLTPLYYACSRRMSKAATLLVGLGADINIGIGSMNMSLAHLCARNLDHKTLSTLLSASDSKDPFSNSVDALGRTPMYIAATEGRTASGETDPIALGRCIMALEAWGGKMMSLGPENAHLQHPVCLLAGMWGPEELRVVLEHSPFRFPLMSIEGQDSDESLGALYEYPIHRAILQLSHVSGSAVEVLASGDRFLNTLRVLLEHGFEPNERLDSLALGLAWALHYAGYTPIQLLAAIAFDAQEKSDRGKSSVSFDSLSKCIYDAAELLVRNGARTAVDLPPKCRARRSPLNADDDKEQDSTQSMIRLDYSKDIYLMLGGEERLTAAQKEWTDREAVVANSKMDLLKDDKVSFAETSAAGGNSDKSCAICWKEFGAIVNRKHKCRITRRYVCDACSSKRVVLQGTETFRVSDGQFALAVADRKKMEADRIADEERARVRTVNQDRLQIRKERIDSEERKNRESLFGGMLGQVFGEADNTATQAKQVDGLSASLNETRNALNERGQRLASLGEKSEQMVDASADFAKMAKELRKKSERQGLFW